MERLPNTEYRNFEDIEKSFNNWIEWDKESKLKRFQQLGQIRGWRLNEALRYWLDEAENCYIMGFYMGTSFFAGAALELGMRLYAQTWEPPKSDFKGFLEMIEEFYIREIFTENEKKMAHFLRDIRNQYAHADYSKLAEEAVNCGMAVKIVPSMITLDGIKKAPDYDEKIVTNPEDENMKLTFMWFNRENIAWKSIKNVHTLLLKLYPR